MRWDSEDSKMKELSDAERLEIAMSLLDDGQIDAYADACVELEQEGIPLGMKPLEKDETHS